MKDFYFPFYVHKRMTYQNQYGVFKWYNCFLKIGFLCAYPYICITNILTSVIVMDIAISK